MKHFLISVCLLVLFALSGCQTGPQSDLTDGEPIGECFVSVDVEVWGDGNGNGLRDAGEGAVAGVRVGLLRPSREAGATLASSDMKTTSVEGVAEIGFIVSGDCDLSAYRIVVLAIPSGYIYPEDPLFDFEEIDAEGGLREISIGLIAAGD